MIASAIKLFKGFGVGFLSKWKLYTVIISLVTLYITSIKIESANAKRQRAKANKQLALIKIDYARCTNTNKQNQISIDEILLINKELVAQFNDANQDNQNTIKKLKKYENRQDNKIRKLLSQVKNDNCCNNIISDFNNKLLKKAIDQN